MRHPAVLLVLGTVLTLLTGLVWRVLDRQKANAEKVTGGLAELREATVQVGTELREHMVREDATNDSTADDIGGLVEGQAVLRSEMREHVAELRGDIRDVHIRLDGVLAGASEAHFQRSPETGG